MNWASIIYLIIYKKDLVFFFFFLVLNIADSYVKESQYPLYKRLATALYELITCAAASNGAFSNNQDNELVLKEGSELVEVCILVEIL